MKFVQSKQIEGLPAALQKLANISAGAQPTNYDLVKQAGALMELKSLNVSSDDWNEVVETGFYFSDNSPNAADGESDNNGMRYCLVLNIDSRNAIQIQTKASNDGMFMRRLTDNTWHPWYQIDGSMSGGSSDQIVVTEFIEEAEIAEIYFPQSVSLPYGIIIQAYSRIDNSAQNNFQIINKSQNMIAVERMGEPFIDADITVIINPL